MIMMIIVDVKYLIKMPEPMMKSYRKAISTHWSFSSLFVNFGLMRLI